MMVIIKDCITNNVLIMSDIQKINNGGLLGKGLDIMKDPKSSTAAKAGAVGIVAIGAIALVAKTTLDVMGKH